MSRAVVIGGGFFGCVIAAELARFHDVVLLERESAIMTRASINNQARIHQGYHYPRSILTFKRSRENFRRFVDDYKECVVDGFEKIYAIARHFSHVTPAQFRLVCERLEAPIAPAADRIRKLFNPDLVEAVFKVEEYAFDAVKLRSLIISRLRKSSVDVRVGANVRSVARAPGGTAVVAEQAGRTTELLADHVFNCTYSGLNDVLEPSGVDTVPLKYELAEMPLVQVPDELQGLGITVMDGPFFSLMPFPSTPFHSMSHVRYTPHAAWYKNDDRPGASALKSRFDVMRRDIARYLPAAAGCVQKDSLWETKAILPQSELNDSRPILFKKHEGISGFYSVLGAKIDNVSDVLEKVREVCPPSH